MTDEATTVYRTPWFTVETVPADPLTGDTRPYYRVVEPDGILIFALTSAGEALMVRQFRPALGSYTLEFPAGGLDASEEPLVAARRELEEETGHRVGQVALLGKGRLKTNRFRSVDHYCVATGAERVERWATGERPTEPVVLSRPELADLIRRGEFEQCSALGVITIAKLRWGVDLLVDPVETIARAVRAAGGTS
jgi:ADP-ribose pyrophosphatase